MTEPIQPYYNRKLWTDIVPYELVEVVSPTHRVIRELETKKSDDFTLEMIPGGFVGFPVNQDQQKWNYFSNEDNPLISIYLDRKGEWKDKSNQFYQPYSKPIRYYDYSF
jgi:hypothetical protein